MASSENILTRAGDLLTGNVNGPRLRQIQREQELIEARASLAKSQKLLEQAQKRVKQLTPVEEREQLDRVGLQARRNAIPVEREESALKLENREKTDELDVNRKGRMTAIETQRDKDLTDNQYRNIIGLLDKNMTQESATLADLMAESQRTRDWISQQNAEGRKFYAEQTTPDFLDYLGKTAQALAPFLIAFTA
jgi:hypothetical protein